jgi:hypothetical protein
MDPSGFTSLWFNMTQNFTYFTGYSNYHVKNVTYCMNVETGVKKIGNAGSLSSQGHHMEAINECDVVIEQMDKNTDEGRYCISSALCQKAILIFLMTLLDTRLEIAPKNFSRSMDCCTQAIEMTPDDWIPWATKSGVYFQYGKLVGGVVRDISKNPGLECLAKAKSLRKKWWQFWREEKNPIIDRAELIPFRMHLSKMMIPS